MEFERITVDPAQMGGVPCIRGLRIPVATVVDMVADGMMTGEILRFYPDLDEADVRVWFLGLPEDLAGRARVGVEFGEGSGNVRFFDTTWDGRVLTATVPLGDVQTPGNRMRIVISLPGMSYPMQVGEFTVTARRSSLIGAVRARLRL